MPLNNFKDDESFLKKLSLGAAGVKATIARLKELDYNPIELERGSTGYKIWKKIKIKRVRVPDILCLKTGSRFEVRAKSKLEISMSHSRTDPNRSWGWGLRSDDHVAVLVCNQVDGSLVDWTVSSPIHFISISDMREAVQNNRITTTTPKGVEEGSEIRMIWPCTATKEESTVQEVSDNSIRLVGNITGVSRRCVLKRKTYSLSPQCRVNETAQRNQIVASSVPITFLPAIKKYVSESCFAKQLGSASLSERYSAAKALRFRGYDGFESLLVKKMKDVEEDIYVRLEAAAALAAHDKGEGWRFLHESLNSQYLQVQLETVIVLSEIQKPLSQSALITTLHDETRDCEIRAGAAWALGEFHSTESVDALVQVFNSTSIEIKVEAARALLRISPSQVTSIVNSMNAADVRYRDGIAWTLARMNGFIPNQLLVNNPDDNMRRWVAYIVGYGKKNFPEEHIANLCKTDAQVHFAASVLWQILSGWIHDLKEY